MSAFRKDTDFKRTTSGSNGTLEHFFNKKAHPTTTKHALSTPGNRSRNPVSRQQSSKKSIPSEVIVIDSDDEPEVSMPRAGVKRRLSEDSDIEIVDTSSPSVKRPSTCKVPVERRSISDSALRSLPNPTEHSTPFAFGKPALLSTTIQDNSSFNFGLPGRLLCSDSQLEKSNLIDLNVDFPKDKDAPEEWSMGDDEMDTGYENDDDEVEFVEGALLRAASLGDSEHAFHLCPSCEQKLYDLSPAEAQLHINNCLDSESSKSRTTLDIASGKSPSSPESSAKPIGPGNNAFSVLMSSFKENEAWKEATTVEDKSFRPVKANGGRRKAPFYKVLQGMPIAVDAFRYGSIPGITAYFLTHAHSDHYTNLSSSWKSGPIYCSEGTANLIVHMLSVDKKWVHPLPMNVPTTIPDTDGVQVTLIEANHCPGSCLFLFEGQQTVNAGDSTFRSPFVGSSRVFRHLHCGDFRASPRHVMHPAVRGKRIDHVYLDTTYLDPKYTFPPQPLVISACAEISRRLIAGEPTTTSRTMKSWLPTLRPATETQKKDNMLVVVGTYSIGKERIVKAIAHALNSKIYCDSRKTAILRCLDDAELDALLASDPLEAIVHLVPLGTIATDRLKIYLERFKGTFTKVIGFRPTGWTYSPPAGTDQMPSIANILARASQKDFTYVDLQPSPKSTPSIQVFPVPYSEHSSFYELTCFAMSLNWTKMIATVNVGSEHSRGKMARWVERWEAERKKRGVDILVTPRHEDYW